MRTDSSRLDLSCGVSLVTQYLSPSHYLSYVHKQLVVTCLSHQLWCCCLSLSEPFSCLVDVIELYMQYIRRTYVHAYIMYC